MTMEVKEMFDRYNIRYKLVVIWILAYAVLWCIFQSIFPVQAMELKLNQIEESIEKKDWNKAKEYTDMFKETFEKKKVFIQMNNSTEALTTFEHTIGQLEITVKHRQDSALEYVGALRDTTNLVIKPFSGP